LSKIGRGGLKIRRGERLSARQPRSGASAKPGV
jgi:hypothetical protein